MNKDELYMQRAIDLAVNGCGSVSPNPMVGAVIVHHDRVIGEGWHEQFGGPHAEVNAIAAVTETGLLPEATLYVTLEPCSHYGKTPPCADLLVEKNIRRVVVGIRDPNPKVAGRGIQKISDAGIAVTEGVLREECRKLNRRFLTCHTHDRPYIILKWAQTADGFIARTDFTSKWISGKESRALVHKWRGEEDAILVGPNTVIYDDPVLTARGWPGRDPLRVVLDRNGRIPPDRKVFTDGGKTVYYTQASGTGARGGTCIQLEAGNFVEAMLADLKHRGILSVLVEGGAVIHNTLMQAGLWDEARIFIAGKTFGDGIPAPAIPAGRMEQGMIHDDKLIIVAK